MTEPLPLNIPHYPMLRFLARHGRNLVMLLAALIVLASLIVTLLVSWLAGIIVVGSGIIVLVVCRALVEMLELITDMLLPK